MVCGVNVNVWIGLVVPLCSRVLYGVGGCWGTLHWREYLLPCSCLHLPQHPVLLFPAGTRGQGNRSYLTCGFGGRELFSITVPCIVYI